MSDGSLTDQAQLTITINGTNDNPRILNGVMTTNSNVTNQFVTQTFIEVDNPLHANAKIYDLFEQGQQGTVIQDMGFNINPNAHYLVSLEAAAGTKAIVTDYSLEGIAIQGAGNTQLELDNSAGGSSSTALTAIIDPAPSPALVQSETPSLDGTALDNTLTDTVSDYHFLYGADGNDTLNGSDDSDALHGGTGADTLNGGGGNDLLVYGIVDAIDGGDGFDIVRLDDGALALSQLGSASDSNTLGPDDNQLVDLSGAAISHVEALLITEEAGTSTLAVDPNDDVGTTVRLRPEDVLSFTDATSNHTLNVLGNPGDVLELDVADPLSPPAGSTITQDGVLFTQFQFVVSGTTVTVNVENEVQTHFI
ncbi:MAG: hypothetical protein HYZ18_12915 [Pseudogulbenkiania sp.]|nr:hypothetical protein [Pseudogulbenkiania sp.]